MPHSQRTTCYRNKTLLIHGPSWLICKLTTGVVHGYCGARQNQVMNCATPFNMSMICTLQTCQPAKLDTMRPYHTDATNLLPQMNTVTNPLLQNSCVCCARALLCLRAAYNSRYYSDVIHLATAWEYACNH